MARNAKSKRKRAPKTVLKLPDLEQSKSAVLNRLTSPSSQRSYDHAIREFIDWYCSEPRLAFNKTVVTRYRAFRWTRFFNPGQPSTDRGLVDILRWRLTSAAAHWPKSVAVTTAKPAGRVSGLRITMVGHASTLIQVARANILTDPVWSERAGPVSFVGPKRVTKPGIDFDDLPPIDAVLLSHSHYDHLDVATLRRLHRVHSPLMVMPLGNDVIVRAAVLGARCVTGDWWDRLVIRDGITTTLTPANHWSNRWPTDVRMSLWSGHYLSTPAGSVWFAGDSGYGDGGIFQQIRKQCGHVDLALIPIGAYEPRWFMA